MSGSDAAPACGQRARHSARPKPQGAIPTLKMPTAQGMDAGPDARRGAGAEGQRLRDAASKHPRWIQVLPNGDVLVAEVADRRRPIRSICSTTPWSPRCSAPPPSASARTASPCCATRTATASPKSRETFLEGLNQPFGMALLGDTFYVGNTDGIVAFPYTPGATRITAPGRKLVDVQARRTLDAQPAAEPRRAKALRRASAR